jgi:hypothetical protein
MMIYDDDVFRPVCSKSSQSACMKETNLTHVQQMMDDACTHGSRARQKTSLFLAVCVSLYFLNSVGRNFVFLVGN